MDWRESIRGIEIIRELATVNLIRDDVGLDLDWKEEVRGCERVLESLRFDD